MKIQNRSLLYQNNIAPISTATTKPAMQIEIGGITALPSQNRAKQPCFTGFYALISKPIDHKPDIMTKAGDVLDKVATFGMDEYKNLSIEEKTFLRKNNPFQSGMVSELLFIFKIMKANLSQKFQQGCTLVSVGRSPAVLSKLLQSQGDDVKFLPASRMGGNQFIDSVKIQISAFGDYLRDLGISKEAIDKSNKPFVFTDYTYTGASLNHLESVLENDQIGIKGDKVKILSLNNDLLKCSEQKYMNYLVDRWFFDPCSKQYSPIPRATLSEIVATPQKFIQHKESLESKAMQFHLIDALECGNAM